MKRFVRSAASILLALALLFSMSMPACAARKAEIKTSSAKIYAKASKSSKVIATRSKGQIVLVTAVKGKWAQVKKGSNTGYMLKSTLQSMQTSVSLKSKGGYTTEEIQIQLYNRGYLSKSNVTGKKTKAYAKAIKQFQMLNGLTVTAKANSDTVEKIFSSKKKKPKVTKTKWGQSGLNARFDVGTTATIVEKNTGIRLTIRRVGGYNHADVEPATKEDTAKLLKIYGGKTSWNSKGVVLYAKGKLYAAAINGKNHKKQISQTNGFNGHFCLHLNGSKTHGTNRQNEKHQANVTKVYNYFN